MDAVGCGVTRQEEDDVDEEEEERSEKKKLSEILKYFEMEEDVETKRKVEILEELEGVVKRLGSGVVEEMEGAASDIRRLAKADADARRTLAMLGAIPPLVGMLEFAQHESQISAALYALLNLSIGNDMNKAAIVEAGAVHKMLKLVVCPEGVAANFLGLTALDSNKSIIGASGAIPFLAKTLIITHPQHNQLKQDCLRALYNLSIFPCNISIIVSQTDLIPFLVHALGDMDISERILSILTNVVSVPPGRKAIITHHDSFPILIDALNWTDSPACQEKASYILMVMAHKGSYRDRQTMLEAGIVSSLLELTLLGTTLAQRRASRILECFTCTTSVEQKGKQLLPVVANDHQHFITCGGPVVSAPIFRGPESDQHLQENEQDMVMMSEETKAVKHLVQQSLQNNMRRIVTRANLSQNFVPSQHFNSLTTTSTSKSLPF